jgi:ATP-dependent RNA helicase RhlE
LDEADHMLDMGFYDDIKDLITYIPQKRQTLFFSATISEKIKDLAYSIVKNPIRIQISPKDRVSKNIDHSVMFVAMDDKRFFLERLIN